MYLEVFILGWFSPNRNNERKGGVVKERILARASTLGFVRMWNCVECADEIAGNEDELQKSEQSIFVAKERMPDKDPTSAKMNEHLESQYGHTGRIDGNIQIALHGVMPGVQC